MQLEDKDLEQLRTQSIEVAALKRQLQVFKDGFKALKVIRPAVVGDGIIRLSSADSDRLAAVYEERQSQYLIEKFVPASGAATRMFKMFYEWLANQSLDRPLKVEARYASPQLKLFVSSLHKFPFYEMWKAHGDLDVLSAREALHHLLDSSGLGYGIKPKALLAFHREGATTTTPLFSHAIEAQAYSQSAIHFTISEAHQSAIEEALDELTARHQLRLHYSFSYQHPSTDTLAVDKNNVPVRDAQGALQFRPAGHGALIANLNARNADFIFIKNIDNVCPMRTMDAHNYYKKVLGGMAIEITTEIHRYQQLLEEAPERIDRKALARFVFENFGIEIDGHSKRFMDDAKAILFRPFRVCAMVPNENEPGGGPFWVQLNNKESLQIVESAQIDKENPSQWAILRQATHFNPVDMVISKRNYRGENYELSEFVDHTQGFIAEKSFQGQAIKALELPGLWNGAMAHWNTIFVEMPSSTFNPVKTVLDLLKPSHQG